MERIAQVLGEEGGQLVPRDEVNAVVEIDVAGTRDDVELLGLRSPAEGVLAEDP